MMLGGIYNVDPVTCSLYRAHLSDNGKETHVTPALAKGKCIDSGHWKL